MKATLYRDRPRRGNYELHLPNTSRVIHFDSTNPADVREIDADFGQQPDLNVEVVLVSRDWLTVGLPSVLLSVPIGSDGVLTTLEEAEQ